KKKYNCKYREEKLALVQTYIPITFKITSPSNSLPPISQSLANPRHPSRRIPNHQSSCLGLSSAGRRPACFFQRLRAGVSNTRHGHTRSQGLHQIASRAVLEGRICEGRR